MPAGINVRVGGVLAQALFKACAKLQNASRSTPVFFLLLQKKLYLKVYLSPPCCNYPPYFAPDPVLVPLPAVFRPFLPKGDLRAPALSDCSHTESPFLPTTVELRAHNLIRRVLQRRGAAGYAAVNHNSTQALPHPAAVPPAPCRRRPVLRLRRRRPASRKPPPPSTKQHPA